LQHKVNPDLRRDRMAASEEEKGEWAEVADEGLVPPEDGADDPGADPELGSEVTGRTADDDAPATEEGIDPEGGDEADATTDGGPDADGEGEPDLRDAGIASTDNEPD
jgi:hypothetical protein